MNVLAVSDIHGKRRGIENLRKLIGEGHDVLLVLGDITQFGPASKAREILEEVLEIDIEAFFILGNCDPKDVLSVLDEEGVNLHSNSHRLSGFTFVGFGGSNETPFDTPFEISEDEIWDSLHPLVPARHENWILATHAPPYGTSADLTSNGRHVGSSSIRRIVENEQPLVNLCGHMHEAQSIDYIGKTKVVNVGSISQGEFAEAVFENEHVEVELLQV